MPELSVILFLQHSVRVMLPHLHYIQSLSCHVAGNTNIRGILIRYTKWWKLAKILLFIYVLLHKNDEKLAKILSNHIAWH